MTTIAYKDGVLAADSRCTDGNTIIPAKMRKLHELPDGSIYTFTGSASEGMGMLQAILNHEVQPVWKVGSTIAVRVFPTGKVHIFEGTTWFEMTARLASWGSGSDFAYGAMMVGASATEAVKAAIKLDKNSGGPVRTIVVRRKRKRA